MTVYCVAWDIDPEDYDQCDISGLVIGIYTDLEQAKQKAAEASGWGSPDEEPDSLARYTYGQLSIFELKTDDKEVA